MLNSRAVSIEQAKRDGVKLEDTTYIVCHLGGGVTSNLIKGGRVLDFVGDDEGGFSPERSGGVPCRELVKFCFQKRPVRKGGPEEAEGTGRSQRLSGSTTPAKWSGWPRRTRRPRLSTTP